MDKTIEQQPAVVPVRVAWAEFWIAQGDWETANDYAAFEKAERWLLAQQPAARPPKPTECMNGCPDRQVCDHCQWPPGPDQQPAACDMGAMDYGMSAVAYTYSEEIDGDDLDAAIDAMLKNSTGDEDES